MFFILLTDFCMSRNLEISQNITTRPLWRNWKKEEHMVKRGQLLHPTSQESSSQPATSTELHNHGNPPAVGLHPELAAGFHGKKAVGHLERLEEGGSQRRGTDLPAHKWSHWRYRRSVLDRLGRFACQRNSKIPRHSIPPALLPTSSTPTTVHQHSGDSYQSSACGLRQSQHNSFLLSHDEPRSN